MDNDNIRIIIGCQVPKALPGKGNIKPDIIPARKIVTCLHQGNYDELAKLYKEMTEWIKENGYTPSGTSVEYYYTGPDVPEEKQVTKVIMPLL